MREFYATLVVVCCDFSPSVTTRLDVADRKELLLKLAFLQRIARGCTRWLRSDVLRWLSTAHCIQGHALRPRIDGQYNCYAYISKSLNRLWPAWRSAALAATKCHPLWIIRCAPSTRNRAACGSRRNFCLSGNECWKFDASSCSR